MKTIALWTILLALVPCGSLAAQTPEAEVRATVDRLFDGMRAGDSTVVRSVLHPTARLLSVDVRDGAPRIQAVPIDRFVAAVGAPHDQVWDERIRNVEIRVDDRLATAWMDYAFYLGDTLSHCGVNAFQLFRAPEGWRIVQIADTRRSQGCEPMSKEG